MRRRRWAISAAFPSLRSLFAYNPGPFNKSWGFNVGVRASTGSVLAFGDADVLCRGVAGCGRCGAFRRAGGPGVFVALDLDEADSDMLRADLSCLGDPSFAATASDRTQSGEIMPLCGGLVLFQRPFLARLGGWDERFLGWGGEDNAMDIKVQRSGAARRRLSREVPAFIWRIAGRSRPSERTPITATTSHCFSNSARCPTRRSAGCAK